MSALFPTWFPYMRRTWTLEHDDLEVVYRENMPTRYAPPPLVGSKKGGAAKAGEVEEEDAWAG